MKQVKWMFYGSGKMRRWMEESEPTSPNLNNQHKLNKRMIHSNINLNQYERRTSTQFQRIQC
jgi:hypothetical protein